MAGKNGDKGKKKKPPAPSTKKPAAPRPGKAFNTPRAPLAADIDALMTAVVTEDKDAVEAFLKKFPSHPDAPDTDDGTTALYNAVFWGHDDITALLLDAGADPNLPSLRNTTPLMKAAERGHAECVALLIAHKAKVDLQDEDGDTALTMAVWVNQDDCVKLLIKAGADISIVNNDGQTALGIARDFERDELIDVLEAAEATQARKRATAEEKRKTTESKNVLDKIKNHTPAGGAIFIKKNNKPPQP